jgi:hypothetical protein
MNPLKAEFDSHSLGWKVFDIDLFVFVDCRKKSALLLLLLRTGKAGCCIGQSFFRFTRAIPGPSAIRPYAINFKGLIDAPDHNGVDC